MNGDYIQSDWCAFYDYSGEPEDHKYVVDANKNKNGHRIIAVKSCFIHCHPNYL